MRGTTPWLSCVGNDDETVHVTVKMYYVGDSNLECVIGCESRPVTRASRTVVLAVHI